MLDYKLIESLAKVVQENGFEKAAKKLHITQSAVSQRIRTLEDLSGQILLARTTPPRATRAGQRMIKHYLQVKQLEDGLVADITSGDQHGFSSLSVGINHDSLESWFLPAIEDFIKKEKVLLDLHCDDQEQTHRLLRDGEVMGCISGLTQPMQGCRATYLGYMAYRLVATPAFIEKWFIRGIDQEALEKAPLLIFNRSDQLHLRYFETVLNVSPTRLTAHYLPSTERFVDFIAAGLAYGFLMESQCRRQISTGQLRELIPNRPTKVPLYWHCWNLKAPLLTAFSRHLVDQARRQLAQ